MTKIIGIKTQKLYAEGTKEECFRMLQEKYSSERLYQGKDGRKLSATKTVYPEPLRIVGKYEKWEEEE